MTQPRLGVSLAANRHLSYADLTALAVLSDDLGYHSIWVPETWGADASTTLALLATSTRHIFLASGVFPIYSRSAALIAQIASSLQTLSGGRFLLGLGASGPAVIENWHGVPYQHPLARTEDYVNIIRLALSGVRAHYSGTIVQTRGFKLTDPPGQPVPIYIASLGPKNVALTARVADGWLPIFLTRDGAFGEISAFHRLAVLAGRHPSTLDVAAYVPALLGDRGPRLLRRHLAYYVGGMGTFYRDALRRRGLAEPVDRIHTLWQTGDHRGAVAAVSDALLAQCTLGSDLDNAASRLHDLRAAGVNLPILTFPHGATAGEISGTIRALAGH